MTLTAEDLDRQSILERRLGVRFRDPALLTEAITHRSYLNEIDPAVTTASDNERLEFLGDAVLDYVVGAWVFRTFPEAPEGELTRLRSALVREGTLVTFARELDLGAAIRLGRGERAAGGPTRKSVLADAFEAVVGALTLDQGIDAAAQLVVPFLERLHASESLHSAADDAKTRLQESAQARFKLTPRYETLEASGPDHSRRFVVAVRLGETIIGQGEGMSKASAAQAAAEAALAQLEHVDDEK